MTDLIIICTWICFHIQTLFFAFSKLVFMVYNAAVFPYIIGWLKLVMFPIHFAGHQDCKVQIYSFGSSVKNYTL